MKIFAISVVKNEADIIESNLRAASEWADKIFVYDNGSTDGTWEKVLAMQNDIITPWRQDYVPFRESCRWEIYRDYKHLASEGDWWCLRLDADEFYGDDPRVFLAAVSSKYHFVCTRTIQFQLTHEDVAEYDFTGIFETDKPHIKYYGRVAWSEARFFRYREKLTWPDTYDRPKNMGIVCPKPILCLHYQYRSPEQVKVRFQVRQAAITNSEGTVTHEHWKQKRDWKEVLMNRDELDSIDEGKDLRAMPIENNFLHKPHVLIIKRILHGLKILP